MTSTILLRSLPWIMAVTAAAPTHAAESASNRPRPSISAPTQIMASEEMQWTSRMWVVNPLDEGIYADSMTCDVEDLDPGETRAPRTTRLDFDNIVSIVPSVAARDSIPFTFLLSATAEHARLTLRLHTHDTHGKRYDVTRIVETQPGSVTSGFPSRFLEWKGHKVEYVVVEPPWVRASAPAILLVHGQETHARKLIGLAWALAEKQGYYVMIVSQPGYGQSQGPPDFVGPTTIQALESALRALRSWPGVDSTRIGAWGFSQGATAVALLAERGARLAGVVAQSGAYDLWAVHRGTRLLRLRDAIVQEAGSDSAAWRDRSPILGVARFHAPLLLLHGDQDTTIPADQAHAFVAALEARHVPVETQFFPDDGAVLPWREGYRAVTDFFGRKLKQPSRTP